MCSFGPFGPTCDEAYWWFRCCRQFSLGDSPFCDTTAEGSAARRWGMVRAWAAPSGSLSRLPANLNGTPAMCWTSRSAMLVSVFCSTPGLMSCADIEAAGGNEDFGGRLRARTFKGLDDEDGQEATPAAVRMAACRFLSTAGSVCHRCPGSFPSRTCRSRPGSTSATCLSSRRPT